MFSFFKKPTKPKSFGANLVNFSYDEQNRPNQYNGYTKIASDKNHVAYKKGDELKIAIAGSNNMNDALTDAKLFLGTNIKDTSRYKDTETFLNKVMSDNQNAKVEIFGHSLSGTIVNQLKKDNPTFEATAYNPYLLSSSQIGQGTKNIRTATDPASLLVAPYITNQLTGSSFNPLESHSLLNFKHGGLVLFNKIK